MRYGENLYYICIVMRKESTMIKRMFFIPVVVLSVVCSCAKFEYSNSGGEDITVRNVSRITCADGGVLNYTYDENGLVRAVTGVGGDVDGVYYGITYKFPIFSFTDGSSEWKMYLSNNRYTIESLVEIDNGVEKNLSKMEYMVGPYYGYNAYYLDRILDCLSPAMTRYLWSYGAPTQQFSVDTALNPIEYCEMVVTYDYGSVYVTNRQSNINLFMLMCPRYLEYSNMDPVLASSVNVFGLRSYYLPSKVKIEYVKHLGEDAETLEERELNYTYDLDAEANVKAIYEVSGETRTKLFDIEYLPLDE